MRNDFKNKVNVAINHGIKLGIQLYGEDIQDFDLEKDLQASSTKANRFQDIVQVSEIHDEIELLSSICSTYLNTGSSVAYDRFLVKKNNLKTLKTLCSIRGKSPYDGIYQVDNPQLLRAIIRYLLFTFENQYLNLNWINVSKIKSMNYFDQELVGVFSNFTFFGDISAWDVSNVHDMSCMFLRAKFDSDISVWDVSNVENMSYMFKNAKFTGDLSKWDVSNVRDMNSMFFHCNFDGDISNWNVGNVQNMMSMFNDSDFNGDLSKWDVSNVKNMHCMFYNSIFDGDLSKWDVSNVQDMSYMFDSAIFNKDISKWNIKTANTYKMFDYCCLKDKYKPKLI